MNRKLLLAWLKVAGKIISSVSGYSGLFVVELIKYVQDQCHNPEEHPSGENEDISDQLEPEL